MEEGGQPARLARYEANAKELHSGMAELGFTTYLPPEHQGCIISTFRKSLAKSEIFNDDLGVGHGICSVVAIFCEHALVLGCLFLSHVASFHRLIKVEENFSSRESLPFSEMWLIGVPW